MTQLRIAELFDIDVPEPGEEKWFADWMLREPTQVSGHLTAGWTVLDEIAKYIQQNDDGIYSALELFGGIGGQSLMIDHIFEPLSHRIVEQSEEAFIHLSDLGANRTWPWKVSHKDSYSLKAEDYADQDLIVADFGDMTVWRTRAGEKHRHVLDLVAEARPRAFMVTDIAGPRLHLQRERYESLLGAGTCSDYESYLQLLVKRLEVILGMNFLYGSYQRWSAVLGFVSTEGWAMSPTLEMVPGYPKGLQIL